MSRRRRGEDFSHLRDSYGNMSDCRPDLNTSMQDEQLNQQHGMQSNNEDKLWVESQSKNDNSGTWSYKSTILAGQAVDVDSQGSTENSYQTARSGSIAGCSSSRENLTESCRSDVPSSMNRAINVGFIPQSDLELSQSTDEPRSSSELNRNIESSDKSSQDSRDTNYNIKHNEEVPLTSAPWGRCLGFNSPRYGRMVSTPTNEDSSSKILKRLSQEFISSPHRFTEKMLTIIDESESGYENVDSSGVNLSRMTREFRKMCKFIQDESMPEHLNSTFGISKHLEEIKKANFHAPETIEESPIEISSGDDSPKTPETYLLSPKNYQKTPVNRFKKAVGEDQESGSPGSPNSTRYFVSLEKYLNEETSSPHTELASKRSRSPSGSDISAQLRDKVKIFEKCEQQLAALDESNSPDFTTFDSHRAHDTPDREIRDKLSVESPDVDDLPAVDNEAIDEDELSMSLRLELEKQRERCFETARQMQKIEEDAKASNEDYSKVLERFGIDPEIECRKTIESLMTYQNCRAKIRRNEHTKKNETSSMDSGIDTRSISRTLHVSSKKSQNTESLPRAFVKNSRRYETMGKPLRSENIPSSRSRILSSGSTLSTKKNKPTVAATPKNNVRKTHKLHHNSRSRSPSNLDTKARTLSRSRSRENKSPTRRIQSNLQTPRTPQTNRIIGKSTNTTPSKGVRRQQEKSEIEDVLQLPNKQCLDSAKKPLASPASVESPILRYHMTPSRSSPIMKQQSIERITKMTNSPRTEISPLLKITQSPRNRFFVTPGKAVPITKHRRLGPLFNSEGIDSQQASIQRIVKSPHAPGIFRNGFNGNVISPVRTYIHGTDMNLIQNVMAKTNEMLLTPTKTTSSEEKITFNHHTKLTTPRDSPRRHRILTPRKDSESQSNSNDESKQEAQFLFAKAEYKLPSRVCTIDKNTKIVGGARTRGLLQSMQNRVVMRHERNVFREYDEHDVPESGSDADMSIHVQKSAEKTNYASRWA